MIIEFTGLPGAGKTTAADEFYRELAHIGCSVVSRELLVQRYIRSHYCRHYSTAYRFRKAVTLLYLTGIWVRHMRARLALRCFSGLTRPESRLSGLWLTEDLRLEEFHAHFSGSEEFLVLSEGFIHHLAAAQVWFGGDAMQFATSVPHMESGVVHVVNVYTPLQEARSRLEQRGRPETWPSKIVDVDALLASFENGISSALRFAASMPVRVHYLDMSGDRALARQRTQALARSIAQYGAPGRSQRAV